MDLIHALHWVKCKVGLEPNLGDLSYYSDAMHPNVGRKETLVGRAQPRRPEL